MHYCSQTLTHTHTHTHTHTMHRRYRDCIMDLLRRSTAPHRNTYKVVLHIPSPLVSCSSILCFSVLIFHLLCSCACCSSTAHTPVFTITATSTQDKFGHILVVYNSVHLPFLFLPLLEFTSSCNLLNVFAKFQFCVHLPFLFL